MKLADLGEDEALLEAYAVPAGDGEYRLAVPGSVTPYRADVALAVIKTCLVLEQPVSVAVTWPLLWEVVSRLATVEALTAGPVASNEVTGGA